jgi:hypothetical protein
MSIMVVNNRQYPGKLRLLDGKLWGRDLLSLGVSMKGASHECRCIPGQPAARKEFKVLEEWLLSEDSGELPLHEWSANRNIAREIHRLLLEASMAQRETCDIGLAVEVRSTAATEQPILLTHRHLDSYHALTIFGAIAVQRPGYRRPADSAVHPVDNHLQFAGRSLRRSSPTSSPALPCR